MLTIGSLFSGYGGLDLAAQAVLGGTVAWHAEIDPDARRVLARHWPGVPNHGDVSAVDWTSAEPVDVLCGGFPCQDISAAGKRAGLTPGTRSGLWAEFARAIDELRPALVVIENVRGLLSAIAIREDHPCTSATAATSGPHGSTDAMAMTAPGRDSQHASALTISAVLGNPDDPACRLEPCPWCLGDSGDGPLRALGAVLGDLADLGYDARWGCVRAADAGAPHERARVFIVARDADAKILRRERRWSTWNGRAGPADRDRRATADDPAANPDRNGLPGVTQLNGRPIQLGRGTHRGHPDGRDHTAADTTGRRRDPGRPEPARVVRGPDAARRGCQPECARDRDWTNTRTGDDYGPAVRRWHDLTRCVPEPAEPYRDSWRLSPRFTEWMQGLPDGWVTATSDVGRNAQLRLLGNGVVPQQAALALRLLLTW